MANIVTKSSNISILEANGWYATHTIPTYSPIISSASTRTVTTNPATITHNLGSENAADFVGKNVDGIWLYISSIAASPTGTFKVELYQNTAGVIRVSCTVNVADLPTIGWAFFKFNSTFTAGGSANAILIRLSTSSSSQVTVYSSSSSTITHLLRNPSATATAAHGDRLFIGGEHTNTGTYTPIVVEQNVVFPLTSGFTIDIGSRGMLSGTTSGNSSLYTSGITVWGNGVLHLGNRNSPIQNPYSGIIYISGQSSNSQFGIEVYNSGEFKTGGTPFGGNCFYSLINGGNVVSGNTTMVLAHDVQSSGWASGHKLVIAGTNRPTSAADSYAQVEEMKLTSDPSGFTVTLPSGLAYGHSGEIVSSGTSYEKDYRAEVMNITRNVVVTSANTYASYIYGRAGAIIDFYYTDFNLMTGGGEYSGKEGN